MGGTDISHLPSELLESIYKLLGSILNQFHFSAVCSSWRAIALRNRHLIIPHQIPLLMLPTEDGRETLNFFSIYGSKVWTLSVPEIHRRWCCGSSFGWIMTVDERSREINLLNPFSDWACIPLPSLDTFELQGRNHPNDPRDRNFMKKFALSTAPGSEIGYSIMTIVSKLNELFFYQPGQDRWSVAECSFYPFDDVICYHGKFYAVAYDGTFIVCDMSTGDPKVERILPPDGEGYVRRFLAVSSVELLQIIRYMEWDDVEHIHWTVRFQILKFDPTKPEWKAANNLGGRSLFVGMNSSLSISPTHLPGCRENCIYFTSNHLDYGWQSNDMRIYRLEEHKMESLHPNHPPFGKPAIWVAPNPWSPNN